jgi:hypothetical protein
LHRKQARIQWCFRATLIICTVLLLGHPTIRCIIPSLHWVGGGWGVFLLCNEARQPYALIIMLGMESSTNWPSGFADNHWIWGWDCQNLGQVLLSSFLSLSSFMNGPRERNEHAGGSHRWQMLVVAFYLGVSFVGENFFSLKSCSHKIINKGCSHSLVWWTQIVGVVNV